MSKAQGEVGSAMCKRRILFFSEAVTLAHVARPYLLATALDRSCYEVFFAGHPRYKALMGDVPFVWHDIATIPSEQFLAALAHGTPVYNAATLRGYVREDLELIDRVNPDVIVGDFRLSLSVSARLRRKPLVTITNAYWSPYAKQSYVVPELPLTKLFGAQVGQAIFDLTRPLAFAYHCLPLNAVRREFGLPSLGFDLRRIYTDADYVAYADVPEIAPLIDPPPSHFYVGPLTWSPAIELPTWWEALPEDKPIVYVTLGSSGTSKLLPVVLEALQDLPVTVIVATAGTNTVAAIAPNIFMAEYIPGLTAARIASLVICNGGSPTSYQALAEGKPVIGIASNLDQYLNISRVEEAGAGKLLRAGQLSARLVRQTAVRVLHDQGMTDCALKLMQIITQYQAEERFEVVVRQAAGSAHV